MLRFCDSADHYSTVADKWTSSVAGAGGSNTITAAGGRFGDNCLTSSPPAAPNSATHYVVKSGFATQATWILGCAFQSTVINAAKGVLAVRDGGTIQVQVVLDAVGRLLFYRGTTLIATGTTVLTVNVWYFIELKVVIGNAGSYEVRINGVAEAALTDASEDTQQTANAFADEALFGNAFSNITTASGVNKYTDMYVCDGVDSGVSGAPNNDFLGDVRVQSLLPNGNGNSSQLVGSDGNSTDNYLLVDDAYNAVDDDTTYVESATVTNKDTYTYADLTPTTGTVYGVQIVPRVRKTDAGTRSVVSVARLSATESDSAAKPLSTTYQYLPDVREGTPAGNQWTISDVNGAEFGLKVSA